MTDSSSADGHLNFAGGWLAEREVADHAARSQTLTTELSRWIKSRQAQFGLEQYQLVDLGCGTGSNVRFLAPRIPGGQHWRLVDHDNEHLCVAGQHCRLLAGVVGLRTELRSLDRELGAACTPGIDVITASALLDLVSATWIDELVAHAVDQQAAVLVALSYAGRFAITPALTDDDWLLAVFNSHQFQDKGGGPALGPEAWRYCADRFQQQGYQVRYRPSPWCLLPEQVTLQRQLLEGWAEAACEQEPESRERVTRWLERRLALVDAGISQITVVHQDILALPFSEH